MNRVKSDYEVLPFDHCVKIRNGSRASLILQDINKRKVCLANDIATFTTKDTTALNFLQKNRHCIRMTESEFLLLVPYANRYQPVVDRAKGRRLIVSCEIWHSQASLGGFSRKEMQDKINEVIDTIENAHLFEYVFSNGIAEKKRITIL